MVFGLVIWKVIIYILLIKMTKTLTQLSYRTLQMNINILRTEKNSWIKKIKRWATRKAHLFILLLYCLYWLYNPLVYFLRVKCVLFLLWLKCLLKIHMGFTLLKILLSQTHFSIHHPHKNQIIFLLHSHRFAQGLQYLFLFQE